MLSWLENYRLDICCLLNRAVQVTKDKIYNEKVSDFKMAVIISNHEESRYLTYIYNHLSCRKIYSYADYGLTCNNDLSSKLGYEIFLCDYCVTAHILDYCSKKC